MPKLQHLARFTTPVNLNPNDTKDTPINTKTYTSVNAAVYHVLTHSTQPLSVIEIAEAASRYAGRAFGEMHVRTELKTLLAKRLISGRKETREEQLVRADGARMPAIPATLYWAPAGPVPARTVAEAVPGVRLFSDSITPSRKIYKYPTKKHAARMQEVELVDVTPVAAAGSSNDVVDYLIEKMVAERTAELQAKTAELQAKLDDANSRLERLKNLSMERLDEIFNG